MSESNYQSLRVLIRNKVREQQACVLCISVKQLSNEIVTFVENLVIKLKSDVDEMVLT